MIPFINRFHGHNSLSYVYKNGQAIRSRLVTIKFVINKQRKDCRIAVVIGKKVVKSSVKRNFARRRVYEYMRLNLPKFKNVYDVVIIISSGEIITMPYKDMSDQLDQLFSSANLLN